MLKRTLLLIGSTAIASLVAVTSAGATSIIDFVGTAGGTLSYAGTGGPLIGSGLHISTVQGIGTAAHANPPDGVHSVTGGSLDFTTGALSGFSAGTDTYTFGSGGSFTLTGGVPDAGILPGTTLVSGTFDSAVIGPSGPVFLLTVTGTDSKDPVLASYFGFPPGEPFTFAGFNLSVGLFSTTGGAFRLESFSTDLSNSTSGEITSTVPEPGSMALLGTGLLGLAGALRRRFRKKTVNTTTEADQTA